MRKRSALSILFRNLRFIRKNGRYRFFKNGRTGAVKICTIEPGELFKGEDIGVDVQELTESIENKCQNSKLLAIQVRAEGCQ